MDIASLGFSIDSSGAEQGADRSIRATDRLTKKVEEALLVIKKLRDAMNLLGSISGSQRQGNPLGITPQQLSQMTEQVKQVNSALAAAQRTAQSLGAQGKAAFSDIASAARSAGSTIRNVGLTLTAALTVPLTLMARLATNSAVSIDAVRTKLTALEGSTERANDRLNQLRALSQRSPGVTFSAAAENFAQLRAIGGIADETVTKIIKSVGRLDAAFGVDSQPAFLRNLVQIFTQSFERADIKEAIGRVPIFNQLLDKAFGTADPAKLRKLKESGKLSLDLFIAGIAGAVESDRRLAGIGESIGSRLAKLKDRVSTALAPVGERILTLLEPLLQRGAGFIERLSEAFLRLSPAAQTVLTVLGAVAAALGPILVIVGSAITALAPLITLLGPGGALAGAGAALAASLGPIGIAIGIVVAAVALLAAAWATNFGGIRQITADVIGFAQERFEQLGIFWREIAPQFREVLAPVLEAMTRLFEFFSNNVKAIVGPLWETLKTIIRTGQGAIGDTIRITLDLLTGRFESAARTIEQLNQRILQGINTFAAQAFVGTLEAVKNFIAGLVNLVTPAQKAGGNLGQAVVDGIVSALRTAFPIISGVIEALLGLARKQIQGNQKNVIEATRPRGLSALDSDEIGSKEFNKNKDELNRLAIEAQEAERQRRLLAGGGAAAAAKRAAKEAEAVLQDVLKRQQLLGERTLNEFLDINKGLLDILESDFHQGLVGFESYLRQRQALQQAGITAEITQLQARQQAEEASIPRQLALATGPDRNAKERELRLGILQLDSQIADKGREREAVELKTLLDYGKQVDALKEQLATQGALIGLQNAPTINATLDQSRQTQVLGDLAARAPKTRDFDVLQSQLAIQEAAIQGARVRGLIDERQAQDALIKVQRAARDEMIQSLEIKKVLEATTAGEVARIDAQIASLRNLGGELTHSEQLALQFAKQTQVDFNKLNDGVLDYLASQKTLQQSLQDFRTNSVKGVFDVLDKGLDKITEKFGAAGDAVKQLLKDLVHLAATKLFEKLLGVNTPTLGGGGAQQSGGGLLGLLGLGGGGSGGGGFNLGGLLGPGGTAPFNPGAGTGVSGGGGSGILGSLFGGGQQGGGGILSKIPFLGKLFGGGAGGGASIPFAPTTLAEQAAGGAGEAASSAISTAGSAIPLFGTAIALGSLLGGLIGGSHLTTAGKIVSHLGVAGGIFARLFLKDKTIQRLRDDIQGAYQINVRDDKVLDQIVEIGQQAFGAKEFKRRHLETIHLDQVKELLANYAEATGQSGRLVTNRKLLDPNNAANQFTKRGYGGTAFAGVPLIVGDRGRPEVFIPPSNGNIVPSVEQAFRTFGGGGGAVSAKLEYLMANIGRVVEINARMTARLSEELARHEAMPPETILSKGIEKAPHLIGQGVTNAMREDGGLRSTIGRELGFSS